MGSRGDWRGLWSTGEHAAAPSLAAAVPLQRQLQCGNVSSAFHRSSLSKENVNHLGVLVKYSDILKTACLASRATAYNWVARLLAEGPAE